MRRGNLRVRTRIVTASRNLRRRAERVRVTFDIQTPTGSLPLENSIVLRTYTADQFLRLLSTVEEFEIAAIHDFCYQIDTPVTLKPRTEDRIRPPPAARRERQPRQRRKATSRRPHLSPHGFVVAACNRTGDTQR